MDGVTGRLTFDKDQSLKTTMLPAVYRDGVLKELR